MKRKAILIGNSRGLSGTSTDIIKFAKHLMSDEGGAWDFDEITPLVDYSVDRLLEEVEKIRTESNDYVIVYFTGHGGLQGETIQEVNPAGELIRESSLFGLASRQLNILDCCRDIVTTPLPIHESRRSSSPIYQKHHAEVRAAFEKLVLEATPQLVRMYSCAEDESSYSRADGSYYTTNLLECSKGLLKYSDVARVYPCHQAAAVKTELQVFAELKRTQRPEIIPTKCLASTELPFCFNY